MAGVVYTAFSCIMEDELELKHHMISIGLFHRNLNFREVPFLLSPLAPCDLSL